VGLLLSNYVNSSDVMSCLFEKVYIMIGPRTLHKFLLVSSTSSIEITHVVSPHQTAIFVHVFAWKQGHITFFGKKRNPQINRFMSLEICRAMTPHNKICVFFW